MCCLALLLALVQSIAVRANAVAYTAEPLATPTVPIVAEEAAAPRLTTGNVLRRTTIMSPRVELNRAAFDGPRRLSLLSGLPQFIGLWPCGMLWLR